MKKTLLLLAICLGIVCVTACSSSDEPEEPSVPDTPAQTEELSETLYLERGKKAAELMKTTESIEELARQVQALDYVSSSEIVDGVVEVTTVDGVFFTLDPDARCISRSELTPQNLVPVDQETIDDADELSSQLKEMTEGAQESGLEDEEDPDGSPTEWDGFGSLDEIDDSDPADLPETETPAYLSRSLVGNRVILERYKIAVWNPWPDFAGESTQVSNALAAVNAKVLGKKVGIDFLSGGPAGLKAFGGYDLVYVSSHGTPSGGLSIPESLWREYIKPYVIRVDTSDPKHPVTIIDGKKCQKDGIYLNYSEKDGITVTSVILSGKYLSSVLGDLSQTIIWASCCHTGKQNSQLRAAVIGKGCPAFIGADNSMTGTGSMNSFRPYIFKLVVGGSSHACFNNGQSTVHYDDPVKGGGTASYNFSHSSTKVVSYFRSYTLGPASNLIRTADVKVRYIYGTGANSGPEFGVGLSEDGVHYSRYSFNRMRKLDVRSTLWQQCARVYTATVRLFNLKPQTTYFYASFVFDGRRCMYSHIADRFQTDGLTGYYAYKGIRHYYDHSKYQDEVHEYDRLYHRFESVPFDQNKYYGQWACWNTRISGNTISYETWTEPYVGDCGGQWVSYHNGTISNDWTSIHTTSPGWMTYGEPTENCPAGPHHHDMDDCWDEYFLQKLPTVYTRRVRYGDPAIPRMLSPKPRPTGSATVSGFN